MSTIQEFFTDRINLITDEVTKYPGLATDISVLVGTYAGYLLCREEREIADYFLAMGLSTVAFFMSRSLRNGGMAILMACGDAEVSH